ncbi:MAG: hypothetical protein ACP5T3_03260 [Candidatus Micrarchaeia archaeon]
MAKVYYYNRPFASLVFIGLSFPTFTHYFDKSDMNGVEESSKMFKDAYKKIRRQINQESPVNEVLNGVEKLNASVDTYSKVTYSGEDHKRFVKNLENTFANLAADKDKFSNKYSKEEYEEAENWIKDFLGEFRVLQE